MYVVVRRKHGFKIFEKLVENIEEHFLELHYNSELQNHEYTFLGLISVVHPEPWFTFRFFKDEPLSQS